MKRSLITVTSLLCVALLCTLQGAERRYRYAVHGPTGTVFAVGTPGESRSVVVKLGSAGVPQQTVFKGTGEVIGLQVDNAGGRLGVLEHTVEIPPKSGAANFQEGQRSGYERSSLHVLSPDGALMEIAKVRTFAWRPSGTHLVVTLGDYRGHEENPDISSVEIISVPSGQRRQIATAGLYVSWAMFDDSVYIWDVAPQEGTKVYRYDLANGSHQATSYHSIYFSPSGEYYYKPDGVRGRPGIFLRATNRDVTGASAVFSDIVAYTPEGWAPDADLLMMTARKRDRSVVRLLYNADTDTALEVERKSVLTWGANSGQLLVETTSGPILKRADELRVLPK